MNCFVGNGFVQLTNDVLSIPELKLPNDKVQFDEDRQTDSNLQCKHEFLTKNEQLRCGDEMFSVIVMCIHCGHIYSREADGT
jgi:hypothetical protein